MNVEDVLRLAHRMELQGMDFYETQKKKVKLPVIRDLFAFLSEMEKGHAAYLRSQIENLAKGRPMDVLPDSPESDRYGAIMAKQQIEPARLDADLGDYSIMRMAYLVEKDFAEFYEKSSRGSQGRVKTLFSTLAEWEKGHADMMKTEMGKIISRNSIDLGFYPFPD
jgi:rubrerythrin